MNTPRLYIPVPLGENAWGVSRRCERQSSGAVRRRSLPPDHHRPERKRRRRRRQDGGLPTELPERHRLRSLPLPLGGTSARERRDNPAFAIASRSQAVFCARHAPEDARHGREEHQAEDLVAAVAQPARQRVARARSCQGLRRADRRRSASPPATPATAPPATRPVANRLPGPSSASACALRGRPPCGAPARRTRARRRRRRSAAWSTAAGRRRPRTTASRRRTARRSPPAPRRPSRTASRGCGRAAP